MPRQKTVADIRALKQEFIISCVRLFENTVPDIKHKKGFTNKDITSNKSNHYAYSVILYKLLELVLLDVIDGNIVYLDAKKAAKLYVDTAPARPEIILGKNAEKAKIPLIDFRASGYKVPIVIFDTGYKSSSLMQCYIPKYLYSALIDNVNRGKKYPKGNKVFWENKTEHGKRY